MQDSVIYIFLVFRHLGTGTLFSRFASQESRSAGSGPRKILLIKNLSDNNKVQHSYN